MSSVVSIDEIGAIKKILQSIEKGENLNVNIIIVSHESDSNQVKQLLSKNDCIGSQAELLQTSNSKNDLERYVCNFMNDMGFKSNIKGFKYINYILVEMLFDDTVASDMINSVTKVMYPVVAEAYSTIPARAERAIRHSIEVAWNIGPIEIHDKIFGNSISPNKVRPTNSEFIAAAYDHLRLNRI